MRLTNPPSSGAIAKRSTSQTHTQQSIEATFTANPYDKKSKKWNDNQCNYIPHSKGHATHWNSGERWFQKADLDPRYEIPSRKYFTKKFLTNLYTECKNRVAHEINEAVFFSTTADLWSSQTTEPYNSLYWRQLEAAKQVSSDLLFPRRPHQRNNCIWARGGTCILVGRVSSSLHDYRQRSEHGQWMDKTRVFLTQVTHRYW